MSDRIDLLFWVTHLKGIGHLRRAAALTKVMTGSGLKVVLVSGGRPVADLDLGPATFEQLPPLHAPAVGFRPLLNAEGQPAEDHDYQARQNRLLDLYRRYRPRAVMTEMYPFGRRPLRHEAEALLYAARRDGALTLCSIRDILEHKPDHKMAWMHEASLRFDHVFVHGDPAFIPFDLTCPWAKELDSRLIYTGYVTTHASQSTSSAGHDEIVISAGGGAFGHRLLDMAMTARALSKKHGQRLWRILVGVNRDPAELKGLQDQAPIGIVLEQARNDLPQMMRNMHLSVSLAGYNTTAELLEAGTPGLLVPFDRHGQSEQLDRALALKNSGRFEVLPYSQLSADALAAAVDRVPDRSALENLSPPMMAGAQRTAEALARLLVDHRS